MKGLYVPPGRRKFNEDTAVSGNSSTAENPRKSESIVERNNEIREQLTVPSSSSLPTASISTVKSNNTRQGVYIPPGRREAEDKRMKEALEEEKKMENSRMIVDSQNETNEVPPKRDSNNKTFGAGGALYVPRGRRELNEKRLADSQSTSDDHPKRVAGTLFDRIEANSKNASSTTSTAAIPHVSSTSSMNSVDSATSNTYIPSDFDLTCSTVIVRGFPANYSFLARDSFATQYTDKGAMVRWLANDQELLAVFKNEMTCLSELHSSNSYAFNITRLCDQPDNKDEYIRVARELYSGKKVDRSNTVVANRLIGAALGIRMPAAMVQSSRAAPPPRSSSPPKVDAWDD